MGKLEKSFYWFCFFLAIYTTIGFKIIPTILEEQLIKNLDEKLTQKTNLKKIEFNPFTLKAIIHDFKILDENNQTTISFEKLSIDFSLLKSIEKQHISFKNIFLKNAFINILEEKDGNLNLTKLLTPTQNEEEITKEKNSSDIDFLVSKIVLENANIKYSNQDKIPYSLDLKNINYTLYDLGTYKNILSSNDLKLKLNENTNISIGGAFKLKPFKAYGKILIEDLRLKEFLTYKKDLLNFDISEKANLNLELNYNLDTTNNFDLKLHTDKFEFNNLNLTQNKTALLNLEKINIKTFAFDLQNQDITLDNIDFNSLKANMILNKNGINFTNLIHQTNSKEEEKNEKNEKNESKSWNINLSNVKLNNSAFIFTDKINNSLTQSKNFNINFNNLKIVDSDINLDTLVLNNPDISFRDNKNNQSISSKNTKLNLNNLSLKNSILYINKIDISKDIIDFSNENINLDSNKINLSIKNLQIADKKTSIENLSLKTLKLNFDDIKSKTKIESSNINLLLNSFLLLNEDISIKDIRLFDTKLDFLNATDKTKILAKNLNLEIKKVSNSKNEFKIEKTELNKPDISIILAKNDIQNKDKKNLQANLKKDENKTSKTKLNIGPVNINNATFNFEDKNLAIPFKTTITELNGEISQIKNTKLGTTDLVVNGVVDKYGVAKITGLVNPNNIKFLTDINMKFQNISMKSFTPYSTKFLGRELKDGKLDLDLKYNIEKSNLEAKNNILITKLQLGKQIPSPDAVSLPLEIAISLLEDSKGVINIDLPVSGNVDDPEFSVATIVWKAFTNLIIKATTAPFSLLGAIFNFNEEEIKSVKFDLNKDEITPIQKETLDKISQILTKRKDIAIKISPSFNKEKESEKIGKNRVLNISLYLTKEKNINKNQVILSDELETSNQDIILKIEKVK